MRRARAGLLNPFRLPQEHGPHLLRRTIGTALLAVYFWIWPGTATPVRAESGTLPEFVLKSAYLYQFTLFVDWPEDAFTGPTAPMTVCVLGEDPFGSSLDALAQKSSQERPVQVRRIHRGRDATACHVLFVSASERDRLAAVMAGLPARRLLTVSDIEGFAEAGGAIEFVLVEKRIRFSINLEAARKAGIRISSKLLNLALAVSHAKAEGGMP